MLFLLTVSVSICFFFISSRLSMHLDYPQHFPSYLPICRLIYETSESNERLHSYKPQLHFSYRFVSVHTPRRPSTIHFREDANILSCIPASNIFIEAGIETGGVLVHCFGGRSRSAAFVAAYLMSSRGWGFDQAIAVIAAVRPVASVNRGFERQLRAYAQTGYDVYAAQQVLLRNRIRALQSVRGSWRSPTATHSQSFRKHRSSGIDKHGNASSNGNNSSRNIDSKNYITNETDPTEESGIVNRRTGSSSSINDYDAKGMSHGIGFGCDSFNFSNGRYTYFLFIYLPNTHHLSVITTTPLNNFPPPPPLSPSIFSTLRMNVFDDELALAASSSSASTTPSSSFSSSLIESSKGQKRYRYRPSSSSGPSGSSGGGDGLDTCQMHTHRDDYVDDRDYDYDDDDDDEDEDGYHGDTCPHAAYLGQGQGLGGGADGMNNGSSEATLVVHPHHHHPSTTHSHSHSQINHQQHHHQQHRSTSVDGNMNGTAAAAALSYTMAAAAYVDPKSPRCRLSRPVTTTTTITFDSRSCNPSTGFTNV